MSLANWNIQPEHQAGPIYFQEYRLADQWFYKSEEKGHEHDEVFVVLLPWATLLLQL